MEVQDSTSYSAQVLCKGLTNRLNYAATHVISIMVALVFRYFKNAGSPFLEILESENTYAIQNCHNFGSSKCPPLCGPLSISPSISLHQSIFPSIPSSRLFLSECSRGLLEPLPAVIGLEQGNILDRLPVHNGDKRRQTTIHTFLHTRRQFRVPNSHYMHAKKRPHQSLKPRIEPATLFVRRQR